LFVKEEEKMNFKRLTVDFFILLSFIFFITSTAWGAPKVTQVDLDTAVNAGFYVAVFDKTNAPNGVWVDPGSTTGDSTTNPTGNATATAAEAEMHGVSSGYGHLLLSVTNASLGAYAAEMGALGANNPTNANTAMFGAASAPVNKTNIELNRAIPAGTEVTFTVNMDSEVPHMVAVMGGVAPTVTYDSTGTGTLTVKSTTFGTTTQAGDTFTSLIGFMVFTDTTDFGTTPLRIIAQTNHWVGDIFPLLPGWDTNASVANIGGTAGSITAKCGTTIYGPSGQSRTINIFFPGSSIDEIFGAGVTNAQLAAFADSVQQNNATITTGTTNFGVTGTLASFTYTFASAKDTTIGVPSGGSGDSGCFIATAAYGSPMQPYVEVLREFRDRFLLVNKAGKAIVNIYYAYAPPVADFIAKHDNLRALVRLSLLPIVGASWVALKIGPLYSSLALMFLFCAGFFGFICFRRKSKKS
jgi:hypothetical protein